MVTITNLCENPSFEVHSGGWNWVNCAVGTNTTQPLHGAQSAEVVASGTSVVVFYRYQALGYTPAAGATFTFSADVYAPAGIVGQTLRMKINESGGASGEATFADTTHTLAAGWQRLSVGGDIVQGDRTTLGLYFELNGTAASDTMYVDGVLAVEGSRTAYFDGDSDGAAWVGTPHLSMSTLTLVEPETPNREKAAFLAALHSGGWI